jgi:hypothetical protein
MEGSPLPFSAVTAGGKLIDARSPGRAQTAGRDHPVARFSLGTSGGRPGTRTRMSYLTRPSNVRVYQFRQPPGCAGDSTGTVIPPPSQTGSDKGDESRLRAA